MSCPRCNGKGYVSGPVEQVVGERYGFRVVTCPGCLGTGVVEATPDQEG